MCICFARVLVILHYQISAQLISEYWSSRLSYLWKSLLGIYIEIEMPHSVCLLCSEIMSISNMFDSSDPLGCSTQPKHQHDTFLHDLSMPWINTTCRCA